MALNQGIEVNNYLEAVQILKNMASHVNNVPITHMSIKHVSLTFYTLTKRISSNLLH